ncbi:NAD(P)-binding Rossmann-fold containing protein [Glarea lozoyensis ATCC 20868]|uniref:NAD(P)-binding Rossmann-fold containing protein n=1 Tax=Glarea lozoyensis (strain ATCC 20868 / MF5171) TaxID=1116229 RepID=S3DJ91_GLAL2|nr:NAD(P)-binding Rossmann-fold containing protein [Glarea lozoyensis ATCC 20868]EPE26618.1 NAD(P)-binding Rossmann-fold containing protein [Glarea lozoyensis ATCC 20868]
MPPPHGTPNPLEGPGDYDVTATIHNDTYPNISPLSKPAIKKSVFIAGASRGIGLAIAKSYAQAGASKITIGARSPLDSAKNDILAVAEKAGRSPPQVLCVKFDITSVASVSDATKTVENEFKNLDILVINAGILGKPALIADSDPDEWWEVWNVNLRGPFLVTRAFLPLLLKGGDKTIVATSSVGAHLTGPALSAYQPSKLAVLRLMEFVQVEYAQQGVIAFAIHPGNVVTDVVGGAEGVESLGLAKVFVETPELSADTIVFLTREKKEWLGGRYINVTWDMPQLMEKRDAIVKGDKLKVKLDVSF